MECKKRQSNLRLHSGGHTDIKKSSIWARILSADSNRTDKQWRVPPRTIEIAIGMVVMVTENLETDLNITNGARGRITSIILH